MFRGEISPQFPVLKPSKKQGSFACCPLHTGFLFGLLFNPEDGGDISVRNVD
jgi:hypothetical protein